MGCSHGRKEGGWALIPASNCISMYVFVCTKSFCHIMPLSSFAELYIQMLIDVFIRSQLHGPVEMDPLIYT